MAGNDAIVALAIGGVGIVFRAYILDWNNEDSLPVEIFVTLTVGNDAHRGDEKRFVVQGDGAV